MVRQPRLRILDHLSGAIIRGALEFDVQSCNFFQADTFRARFSLNEDPNYGIKWWSDQPQILLDIQASVDGGASWTSLILGQVDHIQVLPDHGTCEIDGRDLSAYLIDWKTQETYQNKTASQVADILAAKHGLAADVTLTSTLIGRYYDEDHERIGLGHFTRTTTEWNLLCSLAQREGFDVWVTGTTLHFHPSTDLSAANPYVVSYASNPMTSSVIDLSIQRSMTMVKDVVVQVRSWNSQEAETITKYSPADFRTTSIQTGKQQLFSFTVPNLGAVECQNAADRLRGDLMQHRDTIQFEVPADLITTPRMPLRVTGTGQSDQVLTIARVERSISFENGFRMSVFAKLRQSQ